MKGKRTHVEEPPVPDQEALLEHTASLLATEKGTAEPPDNEYLPRKTGFCRSLVPHWRGILIVVAPLILLPLLLLGDKEARCGYVILLIAIFWMTEVLPIAITSIIPIFIFPALGILSTDAVCLVYMRESTMMFIGGLMVAIAVEHCNLHRRVALFVLLHVGQSPRSLMAGFMATTMFLSMWISNTASTAMMTPIVSAVVVELYKGRDTENIDDLWTARNARQIKVDQSAQTQDLASTQENKDSVDRKQDTQQDVEAAAVETVVIPPDDESRRLRDMCFLGIAYAANLGGTGSLTGSGPNIVLKGILQRSYTEPTGLNFTSWMGFNVPGMLLNVTLAWLWLQFLYIGFRRKGKMQEMSQVKKNAIKKLLCKQYEELGPMFFQEIVVLTLFIIVLLLWLLRNPDFIPGWGKLLEDVYGHGFGVDDASAVMLVVFLLFVIPSNLNFWCFRSPNDQSKPKASPGCLTWQVVHEKVPWNLMFLAGGGFALAEAADKSGLSRWMGLQLVYLGTLPKEILVLVICLATAMVTEVATNTTTSAIILPVLKELAIGIGVNPLYLMLPATVCCSFAFMLPVATPPNAIVYMASNMRNTEMMRAGLVMNIICVLVISVMINTLGVAMFDVKNLPSWVNSTTFAAT